MSQNLASHTSAFPFPSRTSARPRAHAQQRTSSYLLLRDGVHSHFETLLSARDDATIGIKTLFAPPPELEDDHATGPLQRWWRSTTVQLSHRRLPRELRDSLRSAIEADQPRMALCESGLAALRLAPSLRELGTPLVTHFGAHELRVLARDRFWRSLFLQRRDGLAAAVVSADHEREQLVGLGLPREAVAVIPVGISSESVQAAYHVERQPCHFIAVGPMTPLRAPQKIILAFSRCLENAPQAQLTMVGEGPLRDEVAQLADSLGIESHVELVGRCAPDACREMLRASSVYLQHSVTTADGEQEGWSTAIAEAMAAGLPVIATRHASFSQQVSHGATGLLVDEFDWITMGDRMAELAAQPETRVAMGEAAAEDARARFQRSQMAEKLESLLASIEQRS